MNENKENNIPEESDSSGQLNQEETKAFNWQWINDDESAEVSDDADTNADAADEKKNETDAEANVTSEDETFAKPEASEPPIEEKACKSRTLHVSCILSACSIILLVAFAISLMLGIFPTKAQKEVIFLGTSDLGQTVPDTDASPELLEDFLNSVVVVQGKTETGASTGTGVVINEDGYIVTNYHVIEDCDAVAVQLYGEDISVPATVVGYHEADDIAVLKIERTGLRAAPFADSKSVRYGEKVYAIGNPEGVEFSWSVTQGIVSSPLRELLIYDNEGILEKKMNVVQTDASVNHGNSGGPLINVRGEIVGIITLKRADSAGMGFALPADGVALDVAAIIQNGHANNVNSGISLPRPLLGITGVGVAAETYYKNVILNGQSSIEVVTEEYAKANPNTTFYAAVSGVYVSMVSAGSDAEKSLKKGDIITEVNGNPVAMIYDVMDIVNKYNGGDTLTIKYYRDGEYYTASVTLKTSNELNTEP